eukprot:142179_1
MMACVFTIVFGYIREIETLLNDTIIPPEIIDFINSYYKCKEIIVSSDDESTCTSSILESSSNKQNDPKILPSHWTKEELYDRYLPIKQLGSDMRSIVFEGISTWNSKSIGINTNVSIKKITHIFNTNTDAKQLLRELKILRTLREHESIIKLCDILPPIDPITFKTLTIVFEHMDSDFSKIF